MGSKTKKRPEYADKFGRLIFENWQIIYFCSIELIILTLWLDNGRFFLLVHQFIQKLAPGLIQKYWKSGKLENVSSCSCPGLKTKGMRLSVSSKSHSTFDNHKVSLSDLSICKFFKKSHSRHKIFVSQISALTQMRIRLFIFYLTFLSFFFLCKTCLFRKYKPTQLMWEITLSFIVRRKSTICNIYNFRINWVQNFRINWGEWNQLNQQIQTLAQNLFS